MGRDFLEPLNQQVSDLPQHAPISGCMAGLRQNSQAGWPIATDTPVLLLFPRIAGLCSLDIRVFSVNLTFSTWLVGGGVVFKLVEM